jgi:hypothetical protein
MVYTLHGTLIKYGLLHGSLPGVLPFLKELPPTINSKPTSILFANDASYHVTFRNQSLSKVCE